MTTQFRRRDAHRVEPRLMADMKAKDMPFLIPSDPLSDPSFITTLTAAYATSPASYPPEAPLHLRPQMAA